MYNEYKGEVVEKKKKNILPFIIIGLIIVLVGGYFLFTKVLNKEEENNINDNNNNNGGSETTEKSEKVTPLMYEITKEGSDNKIYLFGSIHFANIADMEFPKYLLDAYNASTHLACEFDVDEFMKNTNQQELINDYLYSDGTSLKDHLSKETYDKVIKFAKDNYEYDEMVTNQFKPSFIESLVTQLVLKKTGISTLTGIDKYFLEKAKADKKTILEVESYKLQMDMENKISDKYYDLSLSELIGDIDKAVNDMKELYVAWSNGDEEKLIKLTEEEGDTPEEKALVAEYNKLLLFDRNIGMANKLKEYFNDNKKVFYMVGAAHLVGDKGIAKLLENDGYNVKKVN